MKDLFGSPGKVSGLLLRIGQCLFASASIGVLASASGFSTTTAFCKHREKNSHIEMKEQAAVCQIVYDSTSSGVPFPTDGMPFAAALLIFVAMIPLFLFYLIASMGLQFLWSFGLACLDIHALRLKKDLHSHVLVSLFVVGDWVTSVLSLAAACSATGVVILLSRDTNFCRVEKQLACSTFKISVALAFVSWFLLAISSFVMFWLLASV
ncbi:hypothetical protein RHGRI_007926 [Rhododendron griersonianum]|uniref:CASP-like protein n=1 Tax=Rhododendron griersonianum TaxID=479676 RepID=A0AAV6L1P4_9ERIC|nr:hypothetical protein RHGRI_007926 [Rhododendron griersonianum]